MQIRIIVKGGFIKIENISKINYVMGKYQIGWDVKYRIKPRK